ncbi:MAG: YlbF family regulator [Clostridia bacterium]|nr:YlbF family regulator [Clostridia bacterium]
MEIMELAAQIGKQIKESEEGQTFLAAKAAYEGSLEINNALMEYQIQQQALEQITEETEAEVMARIDDRLTELYTFITEHPVFKAYEEAEMAMNATIQKVQMTIVAQVTGRMPSDCTHDCSTCGGCH